MSLQSEFADIAAADGRAALVTVIGGPSHRREAARARRRQHRRRARRRRSSTRRASRPPRSCSGPSARRRARRRQHAVRRRRRTRAAARDLRRGGLRRRARRLARAAGWRPFVCDPRSQFATRERFPDAEEVIAAWPEEAFARLGGIDRATYIAVLTHDPKLDDAALTIALRSDAAYMGAMGSRRAQAHRRERLLAAGIGEELAGARRRADRARPGGRDPGGDRAFDHGRGGGRTERPRRRPAVAGRRQDPRGGRMIGGLVLAAGGSAALRRRTKQLAELDGRPLLEHALRAMRPAPSTASSWCSARAEESRRGGPPRRRAGRLRRWEEGQSASSSVSCPWCLRPARRGNACGPRHRHFQRNVGCDGIRHFPHAGFLCGDSLAGRAKRNTAEIAAADRFQDQGIASRRPTHGLQRSLTGAHCR